MAERKRDERRQKAHEQGGGGAKEAAQSSQACQPKVTQRSKEVEEWNLQRELIAKSIDSKYEKGKCGCGYGALFDIVCYRDVFLILSSKFMVEGVSPHQLWRCLSCR